jgi:hypothetical protein
MIALEMKLAITNKWKSVIGERNEDVKILKEEIMIMTT